MPRWGEKRLSSFVSSTSCYWCNPTITITSSLSITISISLRSKRFQSSHISFLDEPREETLATQATFLYTHGVTDFGGGSLNFHSWPVSFPPTCDIKRRILWVANLTWFRQEKAKTWRTSQVQITINGNFCVLKINFNLLNLQNTYKPLTNFSYREQSQRKGTSHNPNFIYFIYPKLSASILLLLKFRKGYESRKKKSKSKQKKWVRWRLSTG